MLLNPGVFPCDSFAKYAATFFTISRSSLALASSRRNREFSASSSVTERFTGTAAVSRDELARTLELDPVPQTRFRNIQSLGGWIATNRFGQPDRLHLEFVRILPVRTNCFLPISPSVHQKKYYQSDSVKPRQGQSVGRSNENRRLGQWFYGWRIVVGGMGSNVAWAPKNLTGTAGYTGPYYSKSSFADLTLRVDRLTLRLRRILMALSNRGAYCCRKAPRLSDGVYAYNVDAPGTFSANWTMTLASYTKCPPVMRSRLSFTRASILQSGQTAGRT